MDDPVLRPLEHFVGARALPHPEDRLREVRRRARAFRDFMLAGRPAPYYRSFDLVGVPYPIRYGLRDAWSGPQGLLQIRNRLFVVQTPSAEGLKTVLVSPSDHRNGNRQTPFFDRLARSLGPLRPVGERVLGPDFASVEEALAVAGVRPEQVDYITYDHLHTQDLRRWLGSDGAPGLFPRARLLVMRQEWDSAHGLIAPQRDWYPPHGLRGLDPSRVVLLEGDVLVGEALALLHTPGHTEGNHSIVAHVGDELLVTSENGVGPDAYAPHASRLPGLRRYARQTGMEVVLNGNTLEGALDQYISMVQEKEIAGPCPRNPDFPNMACSSELSWHWAFPLVRPTFRQGELRFGQPTGA